MILRSKHYLAVILILVVGGIFFFIFSPSKNSLHKIMAHSEKHQNKLINENSPYLLQHADNPVDWYPWGEEAFEKAKKEDKPIFLSIGYSTCHWCHVMEHESFEDEQVAKLLNETFVCIKVDREERPDVDDVYMTVCQMMTGSGGWPLTIFMTPDKIPFFAATYIPKENRFGRPGLMDIVPRIEDMWNQQRDQLLASANKVRDALSQVSDSASGFNDLVEDLRQEVLKEAYGQFQRSFDSRYGGFGGPPKFPTAHNLMFLLRYWKRTGDKQALQMVETTLQKMRQGGIFDHIGYGFHRYSTDQEWLVPHFEKMLYDQAILAMAYTETFQATGKEFYKETAEEIFTYVLRDMTNSRGGFYSAEDADSEGEEGKFYVWTENEIRNVLDKDEADLFVKVYNVKSDGNFQEEATQRTTDANILHLNTPINEIADELNIRLSELKEKLEFGRKKLFKVRENRVHPLKDDKILTDWNGLMIAALAKAGRAFNAARYSNAAQKAAEFIVENMRDQKGNLYHRYRNGEAGINGYLDDYAFLIWGLLELYETTFNASYLQTVLELNKITLKQFWDETNRGFYFAGDDAEKLLVRKKEVYDGAIPSGNSVMMLNLIRLARITGDVKLENKANLISRTFSSQITRNPNIYSMLLSAFSFAIGPSYEVVIVGDPKAANTKKMLTMLNQKFISNKVVLFIANNQKQAEISNLAEFAQDFISIDGKATAYVCSNFQCELPTTDIEKMLSLLGVNN
jgi:uncharacterized protein YyaL (SSP411 family)